MAVQRKKVMICDNPECGREYIVSDPKNPADYPGGYYIKASHLLVPGVGVTDVKGLYMCSSDCISMAILERIDHFSNHEDF